MGGKKRSATGKTKAYTHVVDLGPATPPWALPLNIHPESDLRHTPLPATKRTTDPSSLRHQSSTVPRTAPSPAETARQAAELLKQAQAPAPAPLQPQTRRRIGRKPPATPIPSPITRDGESDSDIEVDTDNGADGVYMFNAQPGSWSRPLSSEDAPGAQDDIPDIARLAVERRKKAQVENEQASQASHVDLLLRNIIRRIKNRLREGDPLMLERLGPVNLTVTCGYPLCPAPGRKILPGAYYVILGQLRQLESAERYCLLCLESLWAGNGMIEPLESADIVPEVMEEVEDPYYADGLVLGLDGAWAEPYESGLGFGLDGAMDDMQLSGPERDATKTTETADTDASTPSAQSAWSAQDDTLSPATRFTSTASPSPSVSAPGGGHCSSAAQIASPTVRVKRAGKRDDSADNSASAHTSCASKSAVQSRELRELRRGFGEAFLEGQVQAATAEDGDSDKTVTRRSTRLKPTAQPAPLVIKKEMSKPQMRSTNLPATPTSAESIGDTAAKAEQRLQEMYHQRELALATLRPGESAILRHPHGKKGTTGPRVSFDQFGVLYTDLLAEHVKYYVKPAVLDDGGPEPRDVVSSLIGPMPEKLRDVLERTTSVGGADEEDTGDEGTDQIPATQLSSTKSSPPPYSYGLENAELDGACDGPPPPHHRLTHAQLDGPCDSCDFTRVRDTIAESYKPSPLSQSFVPMMDSRHAPPMEELLRMKTPDDVVDYSQYPETPGGPWSPPGSTNGEGKWRKPPTRFQRLAEYVRAGNSLDGKERAAVGLWKYASEEQLRWDGHVVRAGRLREYYAGAFGAEEEGDEETKGEADAVAQVGGEKAEPVGGAEGEEQFEDDAGSIESGEIVEDAAEKARCLDALDKGDHANDDADSVESGEIVEEDENKSEVKVRSDSKVADEEVRRSDSKVQDEEEDSVVEHETLEAMCGLKMADCRGKDLSCVLGELRVGEA